MQRITISLDDGLALALDDLLRERGYNSRSEGVRDLVRDAMERRGQEESATRHCVANLTYIYNRRIRSLAARISDIQHAAHDLIASTTQIHLDHDHSLESVMLKGETVAVKALADRIRAERGVRSGMLNLVGVDPADHHDGLHDHSHAGHAHLSPIAG